MASRANLRELSQADARMVRGLDEALPVAAQPQPAKEAMLAGNLADGLDRLGVKELKAHCKQRDLKGYSSLARTSLIQRLRDGETPGTAKAPSAPMGLAAIETRLDRMETLLLQIAERVGVIPEA